MKRPLPRPVLVHKVKKHFQWLPVATLVERVVCLIQIIKGPKTIIYFLIEYPVSWLVINVWPLFDIYQGGHQPFCAGQLSVERQRRPLLFCWGHSRMFLLGAGWGLFGQRDGILTPEGWEAEGCVMEHYRAELDRRHNGREHQAFKHQNEMISDGSMITWREH